MLTPALRRGAPYWLVRAGTVPRPRQGLRHDLAVDVAIVGGGITGCMVAYFLARSGATVALLEADRIGRGSTAASTALLMQEPDVDFTDLARRYGRVATAHIWKAARSATADLQQTLRALHIDAAVHALPSVYLTRTPQEVSGLRDEQRQRRAARLSARWLSADAIQALTGITAEGAILTTGNAQFDPLQACFGLAAAAETHGARIFERTPAGRMQGDQRGITIEAGSHRLRASWAIVATGYATPAFKPLASRFQMFETSVIATAPLSATVRRRLGLGDVMAWDTERPYHYLRWTPDHRLLFGGADRPYRPRARRSTLAATSRELVRDLSGFYPSLAHVEPDYAWQGLFATTPDGLPYIGAHRRYPRHLFALGYGGNGITFGALAGRILTRLIDGAPRPADALFSFGRGRAKP